MLAKSLEKMGVSGGPHPLAVVVIPQPVSLFPSLNQKLLHFVVLSPGPTGPSDLSWGQIITGI